MEKSVFHFWGYYIMVLHFTFEVVLFKHGFMTSHMFVQSK